MKKIAIAAAFTASALITGCASTPASTQTDTGGINLPIWVLNPIIEDGLASTDCVKWTGNMSIDRKLAIANARAGLAQQIDVKVKAMDKTYARRVDTTDGVNVGGVFESVSKQVTNQNLSGSRPTKIEPVVVNGVQHLCAMVTFSPAATEGLFKSLVKASGANLNPQDEKVVFEEFKAFKAQNELDKETADL